MDKYVVASIDDDRTVNVNVQGMYVKDLAYVALVLLVQVRNALEHANDIDPIKTNLDLIVVSLDELLKLGQAEEPANDD